MTSEELMQIHSLEAFQLPIGLKSPVRHASQTRFKNDTLILRCQLRDGSTGWGEGLPRRYVTGESIESVWRHLNQTDFSQLSDSRSSSPLNAVSILDDFQLADVPVDTGVIPRECFGNSVRCAVELAVLDSVCRSCRVSVGEAMSQLPEASGLEQRVEQVRYSGVVTSVSGLRQWRAGLKMKLFGFHSVKVKVGTEGVDDERFLGRIRRILGPHVDIRLDANEAWEVDEVIDKVQPLQKFRVSSLEQPVSHSAVNDQPEIRRNLSVPLMLDESLCCAADATIAIQTNSCDSFNLRLSKCGGLVACIRLAQMAKQNGLGYQLGCQVGETGILSAAGRQFACNIRGIRYLEGSYDRFLVTEKLTKEDLTMRFGGLAPRLNGFGLGVTVDEDRVRRLAVKHVRLI